MTHTIVEISKSALLHNIAQFRLLAGQQAKLIATVKANAYGHGLLEVASVIQDEVDYLAVINLYEASVLRQSGIHVPILVLGYTSETKDDISYAIAERIELVTNSLTHAERLSALATDAGELKIHVKVDTGMGRMGILPEHAIDYIQKIAELPNIYVKGVMSHFADAVNHRSYAQKQLERFLEIKEALKKENTQPPLWHMAKTEAILDFGESILDAVRLGIGLYGLWPDHKLVDRVRKQHPEFSLKPALRWKTSALQVKEYPKGEYVGYGCTYQTTRPTKIAVIPVGYYEGFDRGLSNCGEVLIAGERCPIIGRICMNMCMVDVTDVDGIRRNAEVILIGKQGDEEITAREIADTLDTIQYEVVTRINPFIKRVIVE